MRVLIVEHQDDCRPALLGGWLDQAGASSQIVRPYLGESIPLYDELAANHDALIVLGGSAGANDEPGWHGALKQTIRAASQAWFPVMGLCLGHQLVASALGGTVEVNPRGPQLGVLPIGWTPEASADELFAGALGTPSVGVHWNNDVVETLPAGARLLATAPGGEPQVVHFGGRTWGCQLHPEADAAVIEPWAMEDRVEHEALGIDQVHVLEGIAEARADLDATWQPLFERFTRLADQPSADGPY